MKRVLTLTILLSCSAGWTWGMPLIEFSPDAGTAGSWVYNGALGTLSFNQSVSVDRGASSDTDALVGAMVQLPTFFVDGSNGNYTLMPIGDPSVRITDSTGSITYMTGLLGASNLTTIGTVAAGYSGFQSDITHLTMTSEGVMLGSAALDLIGLLNTPSLDFELALVGGSDNDYYSFAQMIDGGHSGSSGFSGAISVPEPLTIALLGLGGLSLSRMRKTYI